MRHIPWRALRGLAAVLVVASLVVLALWLHGRVTHHAARSPRSHVAIVPQIGPSAQPTNLPGLASIPRPYQVAINSLVHNFIRVVYSSSYRQTQAQVDRQAQPYLATGFSGQLPSPPSPGSGETQSAYLNGPKAIQVDWTKPHTVALTVQVSKAITTPGSGSSLSTVTIRLTVVYRGDWLISQFAENTPTIMPPPTAPARPVAGIRPCDRQQPGSPGAVACQVMTDCFRLCGDTNPMDFEQAVARLATPPAAADLVNDASFTPEYLLQASQVLGAGPCVGACSVKVQIRQEQQYGSGSQPTSQLNWVQFNLRQLAGRWVVTSYVWRLGDGP